MGGACRNAAGPVAGDGAEAGGEEVVVLGEELLEVVVGGCAVEGAVCEGEVAWRAEARGTVDDIAANSATARTTQFYNRNGNLNSSKITHYNTVHISFFCNLVY